MRGILLGNEQGIQITRIMFRCAICEQATTGIELEEEHFFTVHKFCWNWLERKLGPELTELRQRIAVFRENPWED